ncbi:MAG: hypothetical protein HYU66_08610 [Armatimonadetes bacterium]|nr:hypothetical protein [Armatimonadota bacterium]
MALSVDTCFPGGGCEGAVVDGDQVSFEAPHKGCPQPLWFAFRVRGGDGRPVHFRMRNAGACLGASTLTEAQPVWRIGEGEWRRLPRSACAYEAAGGELRFAAEVPAEETCFAHCYPYQLADLEAFLDRASDHPHAVATVLGQTDHGRPVHLLCVTNPEARGPKRLVWVTARHHAGETPGSFVLEGIAEALLADSRPARAWRDEYVYCFAPMMDADGVEEGSYGKNQPPVDYNRDWTSRPHWPAVQLVQEAIRRTAEEHEYLLFLDLHAPEPGGASYLVPPGAAAADAERWAQVWRLGGLLDGAAPAACPLRTADWPRASLDWEQRLSDCTSTAANQREHGVTAATVETCYHRSSSGKVVGPADWRALGRAFPRAVDAWAGGAEAPVNVPCPVPVMPSWVVPNLLHSVTAAEAHGALRLEPQAAANRATVEMREAAAVRGGRAVREVVLDHHGRDALAVELRAYFEDARRLRVGPPATLKTTLRSGLNEVKVELDAPPGATAFRLALAVRDVDGALVMRESEG